MITLETFEKMNGSTKVKYFVRDKKGIFVKTVTFDLNEGLGINERRELIEAGAMVNMFGVSIHTGELFVDVTI